MDVAGCGLSLLTLGLILWCLFLLPPLGCGTLRRLFFAMVVCYGDDPLARHGVGVRQWAQRRKDDSVISRKLVLYKVMFGLLAADTETLTKADVKRVSAA